MERDTAFTYGQDVPDCALTWRPGATHASGEIRCDETLADETLTDTVESERERSGSTARAPDAARKRNQHTPGHQAMEGAGPTGDAATSGLEVSEEQPLYLLAREQPHFVDSLDDPPVTGGQAVGHPFELGRPEVSLRKSCEGTLASTCS